MQVVLVHFFSDWKEIWPRLELLLCTNTFYDAAGQGCKLATAKSNLRCLLLGPQVKAYFHCLPSCPLNGGGQSSVFGSSDPKLFRVGTLPALKTIFCTCAFAWGRGWHGVKGLQVLCCSKKLPAGKRPRRSIQTHHLTNLSKLAIQYFFIRAAWPPFASLIPTRKTETFWKKPTSWLLPQVWQNVGWVETPSPPKSNFCCITLFSNCLSLLLKIVMAVVHFLLNENFCSFLWNAEQRHPVLPELHLWPSLLSQMEAGTKIFMESA